MLFYLELNVTPTNGYYVERLIKEEIFHSHCDYIFD